MEVTTIILHQGNEPPSNANNNSMDQPWVWQPVYISNYKAQFKLTQVHNVLFLLLFVIVGAFSLQHTDVMKQNNISLYLSKSNRSESLCIQ